MDTPVLEDVTVRAGAIATALVAVGVVLRWAGARFRKWVGADRVSRVEERVASVEEKVDALAADTASRLSNIEGQVGAILALLSGGKATGHEGA